MLGPPRLGQLAGFAVGVALAALALAVAALALTACDSAEPPSDSAEPPSGSGAPPSGSGTGGSARVTEHTDGDTLWLSGIGKVRLIGVDTPEVHGGETECYGRQASAFVERTLPLGSRVRYRLDVEERDRYGRALVYVWLEDGRFLNRLLVARGLAQPLTISPNVEHAKEFARAARRARELGRGLWGRPGCAR